MAGKGAMIFGWARLLAPIILANIPQTRGIAGKVAQGMDDAQAIAGSSGADRKQFVMDLAKQSLESVKVEGGRVDVDAALQATSSGLDTAFSLAALVAESHGTPASGTDVHLPSLAAVAQGAPLVPAGGAGVGSTGAGSTPSEGVGTGIVSR